MLELFSLPVEIQTQIMFFTNLECCIILEFEGIAKKLYNPKEHTWRETAEKGSLDIIRWLHRNKIKGCTPYVMDIAAEFGHLDIVVWLHENRPEGETNSALENATKNGHIEVVKFLYHNGLYWMTSYIMELAIQNKRKEIIDWINQNDVQLIQTTN